MFKLDFKRQRKQRSNCQDLLGHQKAREFQKNIYFCFIDYSKAFDYVDHNKLWKILQEMGIPDHLTCLLRNLYAGQEATVRTNGLVPNWERSTSRLYIVTCLFKLHAEYIMPNAGLDESLAGINQLPGEISITSDMHMTPPLWQKVKRN